MNNPAQFACSQLIAALAGIMSYYGILSIAPLQAAAGGGIFAWMLFAQIAFIEDVLRGIQNG